MSLNGLDSAAIVEAYQSALTDAGGWYVSQIAFLLAGSSDRRPIVLARYAFRTSCNLIARAGPICLCLC